MHNSQINTLATPQRAVRTIAICSGKGGVGKSNVAVNLAIALAQTGNRCCLLDADVSLANIDVLLGLQPSRNLSHLIAGTATLDDLVVTGPSGITVIPAASGEHTLADLDSRGVATVIQAFDSMTDSPDYLIVDAASGISAQVGRFAQAAQNRLVVVEDEPTSLTDAYALIKVFSQHYQQRRFDIVTNRTRHASTARQLFTKLQRVADRYLDVQLNHIGDIPDDAFLKTAVQQQRAVLDAFPHSPSARAFLQLATTVRELPRPQGSAGGIEFFFECLVDPSQMGRVA